MKRPWPLLNVCPREKKDPAATVQQHFQEGSPLPSLELNTETGKQLPRPCYRNLKILLEILFWWLDSFLTKTNFDPSIASNDDTLCYPCAIICWSSHNSYMFHRFDLPLFVPLFLPLFFAELNISCSQNNRLNILENCLLENSL